MLDILGYKGLDQVHESSDSLVYRGHRKVDNQPVILKMLKQTYPSPEKIAWFKREYETTRNLNLPGVVKAYSLETRLHQWVMVLEDFGGESLDLLMQSRQFTLDEFLSIATKIVDILGQVHQQHIMHKDVNPSNIVWNPTTGELKLIDFGISTTLSQENLTPGNPRVLEGTLAYISPEQTARMNRAIDYRTDFYSLGVTFYELLIGQLPFPIQDLMELIHSHMAKHPIPLCERRPDLPKPLSDIVMKLMEKNAEDRYQSARGLLEDLLECQRQWDSVGCIDPFPLGRQDISDRFQIPQKLYGREQETRTLWTAFERVCGGDSEMTVVSGYSGVGKSALVQEMYKPITQKQGYFILGKFDQLQRDIPYTSLIKAFQSLIERQLLTESETQIASWQQRLLAALGPNGQVIIDVIPEVELIIGAQPEVPDLPPTEAQNRFNLVFQDFITVFTQQDHPLVIFLDDLQWADAASLKLIGRLMTAVESQYLYLIGAYRDNEVSEAHPLMLTLEEIKKVGVRMNHISLSPLAFPHVSQLIADTLHSTSERVAPLAELVLSKTGGNPFFLKAFLKSLYTEGLLTFDHQHNLWQWDLGQIQAENITDNVVELMSNNVQKFDEVTQQALKLAACIGNQFDLETLAIAYQKSPRETAVDLWPAIAEGMVLPLGDAYELMEIDVEGLSDSLAPEYKFAHDRIQYTLYSLISDANKRVVHRQVGQRLLQNTRPADREHKIFDIVNQLNLGRPLAVDQTERDELAKLNLLAGKKAKASAAYQPAFNYLRVGIEMLTSLLPTVTQTTRDTPSASASMVETDNIGKVSECWQRQYALTLELYNESAEVAFLNTEFEKMDRLIETVLQQAKTPLDKVKVYEVGIQANFARGELMEAVQTALQALRLLGVTFPSSPQPEDIMLALQETQAALADGPIEDLINLPEMTDPVGLASMRIISSVLSAAYTVANELFPLLVCKQVRLSIEHGNAPESTFAYASYGFGFCIHGDFDTGYRFGQLGSRLLSRLNAKHIKAKVSLMFDCFIRHWKEHIREVFPALLDAYQSGLETGDIEYAADVVQIYSYLLYFTGEGLSRTEQEMEKYKQAMAQLKQETLMQWHNVNLQAVLNLMGRSENPCLLIGEAYDEKKMQPLHLEANDKTAMFYLHLQKLILCYVFQEFEQAVENATRLQEYLFLGEGMALSPPAYLYDSLARLSMFALAPKPHGERILEKVAANLEKMKTWAEHSPTNYLHKFYLVEAERARVLGQESDAREYYDKAIALAQQNEYLNEEALANELAGRFYLGRGQNHVARHYLRDAHYAYQRWGAVAKVKDLEAHYPQLLAQNATESHQTSLNTSITSTGQQTSVALDLASVLKASQAISGEIVLEKLLEKLMKTVIENAGAQRGFLILEKEGHLVIEAEGSVDKDDAIVLQSTPVETNSDLSASIVKYVVHTKKPEVLDDATHEGMFTQDAYVIQNQPKSILCLPLINQGRLTGILYLENNLTTEAFTPDRVEVLNLLSSEMAISIDNARLYRNLESANEAIRDSERQLTQFLDAVPAGVFVLDASGTPYYANQAAQQILGQGLAPRATSEQLASVYQAYIAGTEEEYPTDQMPIVRALAGESSTVDNMEIHQPEAIIPLEISATPILDENDKIVYAIAAFQDITQRKEAEALFAENLRKTEELERARAIQLSMVPDTPPELPNFDIAFSMTTATEVGGDYYDFLPQDDGSVYIIVGDATGHGMPAGMMVSMTKAALNTLNVRSPDEMIERLIRTILRMNPGRIKMAVNLTYIQGSQIQFSSAGMPPAYLFQSETGDLVEIFVPGLPLGSLKDADYSLREIRFEPNDVLVLVSDGLEEAINDAEEMLGDQAIQQCILENGKKSAEDIKNALITLGEDWSNGRPYEDDITLMVVKHT